MRSLLVCLCVMVGCALSSAAQAMYFPAMLPWVMTATVTDSGVAPAAAFFDVSAHDFASTTTPSNEVFCSWDFGDAGAGLWGDQTTGANGTGANTSRNTATGLVASHLYQTAGTYTATVVCAWAQGVTSAYATVTVADPDATYSTTKTTCITTQASIGSGCPVGAAAVTNYAGTFQSAVSTYGGTGKRVLFRGGDSFSSTATASLNFTGPWTIGSYGTGQAKVTCDSSAHFFFTVSSGTTPAIKDGRVMDLELDGKSLGSTGSESNTCVGFLGYGGFDQLTLLRINMHDSGGLVDASRSWLNAWNGNINPAYHGHHMWDLWTIQDSTLTNLMGTSSSGVCAAYSATNHLAYQGNNLDNNAQGSAGPGGEHVLRVEFSRFFVIAHNTLKRQNNLKAVLTVRSGNHGDSSDVTLGLDTGPGEISDNLLDGSGSSAATAGASLGFSAANSATTDARVTNVVTERNWIQAAAGTNGYPVLISVGNHDTFRNNIIVDTGATYHQCGQIQWQNDSPPSVTIPPDSIWWYNNSCYQADATNNALRGVLVLSNGGTTGKYPTNIYVANNVSWSKDTASPHTGGIYCSVADSCRGLILDSNNTSAAQIAAATSPFQNNSPTTSADFKPCSPNSATCYATGGGTSVPVWSDFFGAARTGTLDMGAVNH